MKFIPLELEGLFLIELSLLEDERGFFARTFCVNKFQEMGLNAHLEQCNLSYSLKKGTLRGMHFQIAPYAEVKLVRCISGSIFDVAIDLRPDSPTFKQWKGVELSAKNRKMLYVPEGFAHGFQTLEDHSEVFYQVSQKYAPEFERGIRWNDPTFNIEWPISEKIISQRDKNHQDYIPLPAETAYAQIT